jgi:hypothetical protein
VDKYEVREPAPGGVREVKEEEPMTLILQDQKKVIKDENGNEILLPLSENQELSIESNMTEQPDCQVHSSTNVSPASDDGLHNVPSALRFDV